MVQRVNIVSPIHCLGKLRHTPGISSTVGTITNPPISESLHMHLLFDNRRRNRTFLEWWWASLTGLFRDRWKSEEVNGNIVRYDTTLWHRSAHWQNLTLNSSVHYFSRKGRRVVRRAKNNKRKRQIQLRIKLSSRYRELHTIHHWHLKIGEDQITSGIIFQHLKSKVKHKKCQIQESSRRFDP